MHALVGVSSIISFFCAVLVVYSCFVLLMEFYICRKDLVDCLGEGLVVELHQIMLYILHMAISDMMFSCPSEKTHLNQHSRVFKLLSRSTFLILYPLCIILFSQVQLHIHEFYKTRHAHACSCSLSCIHCATACTDA